jgi:hypothetical protein
MVARPLADGTLADGLVAFACSQYVSEPVSWPGVPHSWHYDICLRLSVYFMAVKLFADGPDPFSA